MQEESTPQESVDKESVRQAAQEAVAEAQSDEDLQDKIKQITLTALTDHQLDKDNIKSVIEEVVSGVTDGVAHSTERLKPALEASLKGLDEALSKSAIAAKLAAEEVFSRSEKFAKEDMKKVMDDINSIEDLLFDTLNLVARRSSEFASSTLHELAEHLKNTGTSVGRTAVEVVQTLGTALESTGKQTLHEAAEGSKELASNLAKVASGILAGMSEALKPKDKSQ